MKLLILDPDGTLRVETRDQDGVVTAILHEGRWDPPPGWRYREVVVEGGESITARSVC